MFHESYGICFRNISLLTPVQYRNYNFCGVVRLSYSNNCSKLGGGVKVSILRFFISAHHLQYTCFVLFQELDDMFAPPPPAPPVVPATQPALLDKNESRKPGKNLTQGFEFSKAD